MSETFTPPLTPEDQPKATYLAPTNLEELARMSTIDAQQTLVDVLGTPASSLSQPESLQQAVMMTTQSVGATDQDNEVPPLG